MAGLVGEKYNTIEKPNDSKMRQLFLKRDEYQGRMNDPENRWGVTIPSAYKKLVIDLLEKVEEGGVLESKVAEDAAWDELVQGSMNVQGGTHCNVFPSAWMVIHGYIYDPEQINGGTGLPKVS